MHRIYQTLLVATLAITAWIHPATAVSAFAEPPPENPQFINYEHHRETIESLRNEQRADDGRGVLQPQQKLPKTNPKPQKAQAGGERDYGQGEVQELIRKYSAEYGISADAPLCIAKLESGFNPNSKNKSSSASGVFQYTSGTWRGTDESRAGLSVFDADSNVRAAVKYMASRKSARPWTVASKCPPVKTIN